jgi:pimeloyl-ACP methyl ester carboxylesterase
MTEPTTRTIDAPGATIAYDVREGEPTSDAPILMMIGSPMDASGFASLSEHFRDRTVVTYDPRGVSRSKRTDGGDRSTPDQHADDIHRVIADLGAGPVDLFASSGGAVNALALVARDPDDVRLLVAHEPPAAQALPDREEALAAAVDVHETYMREGTGPGMAKFIALTAVKGPIPADYTEQPAPDPAAFGMPTADDGSRDDPLLAQNMISCTHYEPDYDALRAASTRIVLGIGVESEDMFTYRTGTAVAERLGTEPVIFPGGHGGFMGGEFGYQGDPDAFAVTLREVLSQNGRAAG